MGGLYWSWGGGLACIVLPTAFFILAVVMLKVLGRLVSWMAADQSPAVSCDRSPSRLCANRACGHENRAGARFCGRCGGPLA